MLFLREDSIRKRRTPRVTPSLTFRLIARYCRITVRLSLRSPLWNLAIHSSMAPSKGFKWTGFKPLSKSGVSTVAEDRYNFQIAGSVIFYQDLSLCCSGLVPTSGFDVLQDSTYDTHSDSGCVSGSGRKSFNRAGLKGFPRSHGFHRLFKVDGDCKLR